MGIQITLLVRIPFRYSKLNSDYTCLALLKILNQNNIMLKSNLSLILAFFSSVLIFSACNNKANPVSNTAFVDEHTAQNSLDWSGQYYGVLPCADCEGIETILTLNQDYTFILTSKYLTTQPSDVVTEKGKFSWKNNNIILEGIKGVDSFPSFKVEEQQVKYLDSEGNVIDGKLAHFYILKKMGNPVIEDKKWKLVEFNGQPINGTAETHFLIFHSDQGIAATKVNCNSIQMFYRITHELAIHFEQGMTTLMACPDNLENEYLKMLLTVDNLSVGEYRLTLNKGRMAPLAVFELVE